MSFYLGLIVSCLVLIIELRVEAGFVVTRGQKDKFTNTQSGSVSKCAEHYARCQSASCEVCECDEQIPTYVASEKRCMKDHEILPQSGMLCMKYWVIFKHIRILMFCDFCPETRLAQAFASPPPATGYWYCSVERCPIKYFGFVLRE